MSTPGPPSTWPWAAAAIQAVVKNGEKIQYYGGKSQQLEKTTRVKARVKAHALRELLETKDRLLIMGHKIGDIDSFGSAIGVYRIAAALGKRPHICHQRGHFIGTAHDGPVYQ